MKQNFANFAHWGQEDFKVLIKNLSKKIWSIWTESVISNGRENNSGFGQHFNFKLDSFDKMRKLQQNKILPFLHTEDKKTLKS